MFFLGLRLVAAADDFFFSGAAAAPSSSSSAAAVLRTPNALQMPLFGWWRHMSGSTRSLAAVASSSSGKRVQKSVLGATSLDAMTVSAKSLLGHFPPAAGSMSATTKHPSFPREHAEYMPFAPMDFSCFSRTTTA